MKTSQMTDALVEACEYHDLSRVKELTRLGANPLSIVKYESGSFPASAMSIAVASDDLEIVRYFLEAGINPTESLDGVLSYLQLSVIFQALHTTYEFVDKGYEFNSEDYSLRRLRRIYSTVQDVIELCLLKKFEALTDFREFITEFHKSTVPRVYLDEAYTLLPKRHAIIRGLIKTEHDFHKISAISSAKTVIR